MYRGPSIDHTILSPSGRVSKRTREAALKRAAAELFDDVEWGRPAPKTTEKERDLRVAQELRELAARGMGVRKHIKEAERLEAKWT